MLSSDSAQFQDAIARLQAQSKLPRSLSPRQVALLQASFNKYADAVGQRLLDDLLADFQSKISDALAARAGGDRSDVLYNLGEYAGDADIADRLRWSMHVAQQVVAGAGRFLNQNLSPEAVDEYPALALERYFPRVIPRGWKREGKTVIPVPDQNWPARWAEAGAAAGDDAWLPWSGDSQTGRGVALKSSGIWQALGSLRDDSLGNPYPPFAFNSGFMTTPISRAETESLGLLAKGQAARPAKIDLASIFNFNPD